MLLIPWVQFEELDRFWCPPIHTTVSESGWSRSCKPFCMPASPPNPIVNGSELLSEKDFPHESMRFTSLRNFYHNLQSVSRFWTLVLSVCTNVLHFLRLQLWTSQHLSNWDGFLHAWEWQSISWVPSILRWFDECVRNKRSAFEGSALMWIVPRPPSLLKKLRPNAPVAQNAECPLSL